MEEVKNVVPEENLEKEETGLVIKNFGSMARKTNTKADIFTNITDQKKIFNLDSKVDNLFISKSGEIAKASLVKKSSIGNNKTSSVNSDKEENKLLASFKVSTTTNIFLLYFSNKLYK